VKRSSQLSKYSRMSVLFRARVVRGVAGVYSRENEATRRRPGEGNGRVEVKDSRRGGGKCMQQAGADEGN